MVRFRDPVRAKHVKLALLGPGGSQRGEPPRALLKLRAARQSPQLVTFATPVPFRADAGERRQIFLEVSYGRARCTKVARNCCNSPRSRSEMAQNCRPACVQQVRLEPSCRREAGPADPAT